MRPENKAIGGLAEAAKDLYFLTEDQVTKFEADRASVGEGGVAIFEGAKYRVGLALQENERIIREIIRAGAQSYFNGLKSNQVWLFGKNRRKRFNMSVWHQFAAVKEGPDTNKCIMAKNFELTLVETSKEALKTTGLTSEQSTDLATLQEQRSQYQAQIQELDAKTAAAKYIEQVEKSKKAITAALAALRQTLTDRLGFAVYEEFAEGVAGITYARGPCSFTVSGYPHSIREQQAFTLLKFQLTEKDVCDELKEQLKKAKCEGIVLESSFARIYEVFTPELEATAFHWVNQVYPEKLSAKKELDEKNLATRKENAKNARKEKSLTVVELENIVKTYKSKSLFRLFSSAPRSKFMCALNRSVDEGKKVANARITFSDLASEMQKSMELPPSRSCGLFHSADAKRGVKRAAALMNAVENGEAQGLNEKKYGTDAVIDGIINAYLNVK